MSVPDSPRSPAKQVVPGRAWRYVIDANGKPTTLTPEIHAEFLKELAVGDFPQLAALRCRLPPRTARRWVEVGCDPLNGEPYVSFAEDVIRQEAQLAGELFAIILDDARGTVAIPDDEGTTLVAGKRLTRRPNAEQAKWILENRFRFFWQADKDGKVGALSITEIVERQLEQVHEGRREQARKILASIPAEARAAARKEGFLL